MRALVVVEMDPVADGSACMLQGFEPVTMDTLLFQSSNHPFDQTVLLRGVGRDELLLQSIAFNECGVAPARKNEPPKFTTSRADFGLLDVKPAFAIKDLHDRSGLIQKAYVVSRDNSILLAADRYA